MYTFAEQTQPLEVCINITNNVTIEADLSITFQTDANQGTAEREDFEMLEDIFMITGRTCFEILIFPDTKLEGNETFRISIESMNSALNLSVPQAEVTILDSTSKTTHSLSSHT